MSNDPRTPMSSPDSRDTGSGRPAWVGPLVGLVVLAILVFAGMQAWRFMQPPATAATKPVVPVGKGRPMFTLTGTVSRTAKDGQKQAAKDATVMVLQPMWTSDQQQEWERRTNEMVAKACGELGPGEPPPTVTADPASVRRADEAMARRQQAAKTGSPWAHRCSTEFLALLKENAIEVKQTTTEADGAYSVSVPPPEGVTYIVHAKAPDGEWLAKLAGRSGKLDLNDTNLIPD